MKRSSFLGHALLFVGLMSCAQKTTVIPPEIDLYFTQNIQGELFSCGCGKFPLGGLREVHQLIQGLTDQTKTPYLLVDTGDTFFPLNMITQDPSLREQAILASETLAKSFALTGASIFTPGESDFSMGEKELAKLLAWSPKTQLLLTNYEGNELTAKKKIQLQYGSHTVHLLGVLQPELTRDKGYTVNLSDEFQAIATELAKIPDTAQHHVILLSHTNNERLQQITERFPRLHWIVTGHNENFFQRPQKWGQSWIAEAKNKNQYLGVIKNMFSSEFQYELLPVFPHTDGKKAQKSGTLQENWRGNLNEQMLQKLLNDYEFRKRRVIKTYGKSSVP